MIPPRFSNFELERDGSRTQAPAGGTEAPKVHQVHAGVASCLTLLVLAVGAAALLAEVTASVAFSQQLWLHLGLGPRRDVWPPPGTFLPSQPAAIPGSYVPGGSNQHSVSRFYMMNTTGGLFQVELGTPTTQITSLQNLSQYISLAPGRALQVTEGFQVRALASWGDGGFVAGTWNQFSGKGGVEVWPNRSLVEEGARAPWILPGLNATGRVGALLTLDNGGILAGVFNTSRSLLLWPDATAVQNGHEPSVLYEGRGVCSLLTLPSGALAVGVGGADAADVTGRVLLWQSLDLLLQKAPPSITLQAPGFVCALSSLPGGGLAAGAQIPKPAGNGTVEVWINSSALLSGARTSQLTLAGWPTGFLPLPGGGLMVSVETQEAGGYLGIWSNLSSVLQGGPPPMKATTSRQATCLLQLQHGALIAGTENTVDLWTGVDAALRGEPPAVTLTACWITALLPLSGEGLLGAGFCESGQGALSVWPYVPPLLQHARGSRLQATDNVFNVIALGSGGVAAATSDLVTGDAGGVDVWQQLDSERVRLPASGTVHQLQELANGGIVTGSGNLRLSTGVVDVWLNASAVRAGGGPSFSLPTSGLPNAVLVLSTGILAAGTCDHAGVGHVDLWSGLSGLVGGERPIASLRAAACVTTLIELPGGGVAAGTCTKTPTGLTGPSTVDVWPNSSFIYDGARALVSLPAGTTEGVWGLLALPSGGIAAGTQSWHLSSGTVLLWPTAAPQGPAARRLQLPCGVNGLIALPGGGVAAALAALEDDFGALQLWPDEQLLLSGKPAHVSLQSNALMIGGAALPGGGLAAATTRNTVELWPSTWLQRADPLVSDVPAPAGAVYAAAQLSTGFAFGTMGEQGPSVELWRALPSGSYERTALVPVSSVPVSILELSSQHLVVGSINGTIDVFTTSASALQPFAKCATEGTVYSLAPMPLGGFVAAVDPFVGTGGYLASWSSLQDAVNGPPQVLNLSFSPRALHWLGDRLLIGTAKTLETWTPSNGMQTQLLVNLSGAVSAIRTLPADGLAIATDDYQVQIWLSSKTIELQRHADLSITIPMLAASLALLDDGSLVAGGAAFVPVKCPSGSFSPGGSLLDCTPCPFRWRSEPGASSCRFADNLLLAGSSAAFVACLACGLVAGCLFRRFAARLWGFDKTKRLLLLASLLLLALAFTTDFKSISAANLTFLLLCLALSCLLLLWSGIARTDDRYFSALLLLIVLVSTLQQFSAPREVAVMTAVGQLMPGASFSWWLQALLTLSLGLAGLAYVVPTTQSLSKSKERISSQVDMAAFATAAMQVKAVWMEVRCCGRLRPLLGLRKPLGTLLRSFVWQHGLVVALALYTVVQMSLQLALARVDSVSRGLIALSIMVSLLKCASSGFAIFVTRMGGPQLFPNWAGHLVDRHFRVSIALKYLALALKLMVLVLPFQETLDVTMWWQCQTPALCPSSCTDPPRSGTCGTMILADGQAQCTCMAFRKAQLRIVYNCAFTLAVSVCLTACSSRKYFRIEGYVKNANIFLPRCKLLAHGILVLVPAAVQGCYLWLLCQAHAACLTLADVAIIVYPSLMLGLMANEVKRALAVWRVETRDLFSTTETDDLVLTMRPFSVLFAFLGSAAAAARAKSVGPLWPTTSTDCSSTVLPWVIISVLFAVGAVAALIMGHVAKPAEEENDSLTQQLHEGQGSAVWDRALSSLTRDEA